MLLSNFFSALAFVGLAGITTQNPQSQVRYACSLSLIAKMISWTENMFCFISAHLSAKKCMKKKGIVIY